MREAIFEFGDSDWTQITDYVNARGGYNRKRDACKSRWKRTLNPVINKGAWTSEETERLLALVNKYGERNWGRIAREMETRTDVQCRYRYKLFQRNKSMSAQGKIDVKTTLPNLP